MKMVDAFELTKQAVAQTVGKEYMEENGYLEGMDSWKIADLGKYLDENFTASGANLLDVYSNALMDRLGAMYLETRKSTAKYPDIFVDPMEWGAFLVRVKGDFLDIVNDGMWSLEDGKDFSQLENTFYQPKAKSKIFSSAIPCMLPISITRAQLTTAFTSWAEMNKFITMIESWVEKTIDKIIKTRSKLLVCCGIAISTDATDTAVHLLTEYNGTDGTLTADKALYDKDFVEFMSARIKEVQDAMQDDGTMFNNHKATTVTPDNDIKTLVLNKVDTAIAKRVQPNLYGQLTIGNGNYKAINSWQSSYKNGSDGVESLGLDTVSAVKINADADNTLGIGTSAYNKTNVVAFVYDRMAMGCTLERDAVTSKFIASGNFTNRFHHLLESYIIDDDYNMVAFLLD